MREENPLVMILIELCHMTSTWNMSCDQSQVDIYCIEPTLNFYINLKMALFLFIQGRIQRSICMHKMDYIFDITGRNVEKSDSQVILFFLHIFVTSLVTLPLFFLLICMPHNILKVIILQGIL